MRREFVQALTAAAERDKRIVLLTGDLGFAALEPFIERFPDRFFNAGVAEQNMVGMATGLAEAGFTPWAYSISTFSSMRAYEFIRNGPVLHNLPVRVVGIGEGLDYSHNGMTHYAIEDVALMRAQPGLALATPCSSNQVSAMVDALQALPGPAYIRLTKLSYEIPGLAGEFAVGRAHRIAEGADAAIVALGGMASAAAEAGELLGSRGVNATVVAVSSVAPPPAEDLLAVLSSVPFALTAEAHYVTGGIGSLVAELIAEHGLSCRLMRAGIRELPVGLSGSSTYLNDRLGLAPEQLAEIVAQAVAELHAAT